MLGSGKAGFKREFLEIKGIPRRGLKPAVCTSPRNEGFREVIPAVLRVPSIAEKMVPSNGSGPILVIYHYGISWHPEGFYLIYLHTMSNYPHAVGTRTRRCPRDRI